ncbi:hypothetical protein Ahos_1409 [Acidianus hospitalis W1]|uniref:Uncharacterized protein n=1 Tax=Acidianus hospitalis (strain W1) TaxID=933801 RepID=F4B4R2_ACIHW|nr:hypothetical protein [Acidianus hospitalis]AEE94292.1 hypothetical protein Ahos_1409 [Acidianus hospitalis W1]
MPYSQGKFCFPLEVKEIRKGDIIVVKPTSVKSNGVQLVLPSLSLISESCNRKIDSLIWVDGVRIHGNEEIIFDGGKFKVQGKIKVESPEFLPGYILKKLLDDKEILINSLQVDGIPIVSIENFPLIYIKRDTNSCLKIHVNSVNNPILELASLSLYYYISSEYSEEI